MSGLTKAQASVAKLMVERGEALRQGPVFIAGGFTLCDAKVIDRMERKGAVRVETIGQSVFASLTPAGLAALSVDPPQEKG